jgi:EAL domain-containing protein (putative c-di-GMP-specific phosphodiesterase class I)
MYQAKSAGKARYVVFNPAMHQTVMEGVSLENDLRRAVQRDEFEVYYEPIVGLDNGKLAGFEALVRWNHPTRGLVQPGEFIDLAEEIGLIIPIGEMVLRKACKQLHDWQVRYPKDPPLFMSVNLSRSHLLDTSLERVLRRTLAEARIIPLTLNIEITESMVMHDVKEMAQILGRVKSAGVKLAMDDFGTGQSSLHCLHQFPLDLLKIDRTFLTYAGENPRRHAAILHVITELASNLGMQVVAEGIENESHLQLLQGLSCRYGQGWHFSEPANAAGAELLLRDGLRRSAA